MISRLFIYFSLFSHTFIIQSERYIHIDSVNKNLIEAPRFIIIISLYINQSLVYRGFRNRGCVALYTYHRSTIAVHITVRPNYQRASSQCWIKRYIRDKCEDESCLILFSKLNTSRKKVNENFYHISSMHRM